MLLPGISTQFNILNTNSMPDMLGARNSMVIKKDMVYSQKASSKYCPHYNNIPSNVDHLLSKGMRPISTKSLLFLFGYHWWWRCDWCRDDSRFSRLATGIKDSSTSDHEFVDRCSGPSRTSGKVWWEWDEPEWDHTTSKVTVVSPSNC